MKGSSEPVTLAVRLARDEEGTKALAVSDGTEETRDGHKRPKWFWLPRSLISAMTTPDRQGYFEVTIPEWLAKEKGLI